jgi:hypothetical protein
MTKFFKTLILVAAIGLLFASCSKDSDETDSLDSLAGTTWVDESGDVDYTLSFTDKSNCAMSAPRHSTSYGTYSYTPPSITMSMSGYVWTGIVSGNTMTLTAGGTTGTFVKR